MVAGIVDEPGERRDFMTEKPFVEPDARGYNKADGSPSSEELGSAVAWSRGQCLNGSDLLCFERCLSASESSISAVKSETKATKSSTSSDGPGMTADSSHRA